MPRPRTPTAQKELKGTAQKCRINQKEPQVKQGIPIAPEHLSERAKSVFKKVSEWIYGMGYLTVPDGMALEALCQTYCDWREAVEFLDKNGSVYIVERCSPDGVTHEEFKPYPQVAQRNDANRQLRGWLASCGLTPADRSRVQAIEQKEESPWAEFVN